MTLTDQKSVLIELMKLLKVHSMLTSDPLGLFKLRLSLLRSLLSLDLQAGFRERLLYTFLSIVELGLAGIIYRNMDRGKMLALYEEFCDQEYPRIGEMLGMAGFVDWLRLRETNEQELMLVKAKDDFLAEGSEDGMECDGIEAWVLKESLGNWRPRKTWMDADYIEGNPESIVFFSDVREVVDLIDVDN
jgi:hypothetical protein